MTRFRIRYDTHGGHTHCRLFSMTSGQPALAGKFILRNAEFEELRRQWTSVEFLPEELQKARDLRPIEEPHHDPLS